MRPRRVTAGSRVVGLPLLRSGVRRRQPAVYQAMPRDRDGALVWRLVERLGEPSSDLWWARVEGRVVARTLGLEFRPEVVDRAEVGAEDRRRTSGPRPRGARCGPELMERSEA